MSLFFKQREAQQEEERLQKQQEEDEARAQAAAAKKEKDAQKKILKKERKVLRTFAKDFNYFASDEATRVANMSDVEKLCELLEVIDLQSLNKTFGNGEQAAAKQAFLEQVMFLRCSLSVL